jgi:hypothetical protein
MMTGVSEVLTASIIRVLSKPHTRKKAVEKE